MWPTDLDAEVAIRRQKLAASAAPRRVRTQGRWRRGLGVWLVRLGLAVAGPKALERPAPTVACR